MIDIQLALNIASVCGVVLTAIGAFIGVMISLRNGRIALVIATRGTENAHAIQKLEITLNGKLAELVRVTAALARAEGIAQGKAEAAGDPSATALAAVSLFAAQRATLDGADTSEPKK